MLKLVKKVYLMLVYLDIEQKYLPFTHGKLLPKYIPSVVPTYLLLPIIFEGGYFSPHQRLLGKQNLHRFVSLSSIDLKVGTNIIRVRFLKIFMKIPT